MIVKPPERLDQIKDYLRGLPDFKTLENNDDFMMISTELMNHTLFLQKFGLSTAPSQTIAEKGILKRQAVILGHMIRQMKLYEGFLIHIANRQLELASIFIRLIYETNVRIDYFLNTKASSVQSYIFTSYKSEKETLLDLKEKAQKRPLIHIEKRIQKKISNRLKRDGISQRKLLANKNWRIDNKTFKGILKFLNREKEYPYMFGSGSHFIHGDWYEISNYHLKKEERYFHPVLEFDNPDPRVTCSISALCLNQLIKYLKWRKCDPHKYIISIAEILFDVFIDLDQTHERYYQKQYTT